MGYARCPTCGYDFSKIQILWEEGRKKIKNSKLNDEERKKKISDLLDELQIKNICCRPRMLTLVDTINLIK